MTEEQDKPKDTPADPPKPAPKTPAAPPKDPPAYVPEPSEFGPETYQKGETGKPIRQDKMIRRGDDAPKEDTSGK